MEMELDMEMEMELQRERNMIWTELTYRTRAQPGHARAIRGISCPAGRCFGLIDRFCGAALDLAV